MKEKTERLSNEKSIEIANRLIEVFKTFCKNVSVYLLSFPIMEDDTNEQDTLTTYTIYEWNENMGNEIRKIQKEITTEEDIFCNNTYKVTYKGQKYEINIFDSPEACGYNSILTDYDETTYLLAYVKELDAVGTIKYEIFFGFNILNMTFLELFDIDYINKKGCIRKCVAIDDIQKKYEGKELTTIL